MTPLEYIMQLDRKIQMLERENTPFKIAVQTVHALRMERIFTRGEKADGSKIGQYSTKPIYINPKISPKKFTGKGKNDKRNNKTHKTRYFAEGYKGFRQFINRPSEKIDLGLSYDLRFDLSNSKSFKVGLPEKVSPAEYIERLKRPHNVEKFAGMEKRFGNIGGFTQKERETFVKVNAFELQKFLQ